MRDNWENKPLNEITTLIKDGTHGTHKDTPGGIPLLSAKDISNGHILIPEGSRLISEKDFDQIHKNYNLEIGDVVLTLVGTIGRVAILENYSQKFTFQRSVGILKFKNFIDSKYAYYFISSENFYRKLIRSMNASAQGGVYLGELGTLKLSYPTFLPQQKKIAQILSTCDAVLEKTEAAIAKCQALKQGLMHDLFTCGMDAIKGQLRPSYNEAPELYKKTALGFVPKEWEIGAFKDVVEQNSPITYGIVQPGKYSQNGVLLIRGKDYISGWAKEEGFFKVSKDLNNQFKRSITRSGDILICIVGATYGAVGVVPDWISEANITQTTARIRCDKNVFDPYFIEYYLKSEFGRIMIEKYVKGSAQPGLNLADVEKFILIHPKSLEEQILIGKRLKSIDQKIQSEQQTFSKYKQLKAGLMQDLLSGKVGVEGLVDELELQKV